MKLIKFLVLNIFILLLMQYSNAEIEKTSFILSKMEDDIKKMKMKQENMHNVITECRRIFLELIAVEGVNITMDFFDKIVDPFGHSIITSMETQILILKNEAEQKKESNNENELEFCKTELNSLKNLSNITNQLQKTENVLEANLNSINKLITQKDDELLKDLEDIKNEVNECKTGSNYFNAQLDTIKKCQDDFLTRVNSVNDIRKQQENLSEHIKNLTNIVKENTLKGDIATELNKINYSLEKIYIKVRKLLQNVLPKSCDDIIKSGLGAGVYTLFTAAGELEVFCDNSGKMLIQKQMEGPIDFDRNWIDYKNGFGSPLGQYWIGLENLHILTSTQHYELFYYIKDFDNVQNYSSYDHFVIGSEYEEYKISKIGAYNGNTSLDAFTIHLNMKFTTKDHPMEGFNCAVSFKCGWWYNWCHRVNLNLIVGTRDYKPQKHLWNVLNWIREKPLKEASMYIKLHK